MVQRRTFLKSAAAALTAPAALSLLNPLQAAGTRHKDSFLPMGFAGYTFLNYPVDQAIAIMQRVGINCLSIKDFHLPLDSTPEKIAEVTGKFKAANITIYAVGVIYMKTEAEADRAFDYAKKVGVDLIVGVPNYELIPYVEQKVKSSNIRLAVHNHGPEDKLYPGPKDVYDRIKNLDSRIGLCLDIGHSLRAGTDPAKAVQEYGPRIFDLHVKDVANTEKNAPAIEMGRGAINFPAFVKALYKLNYAGKCSIEYEKDMKDSIPGIAESVGYFRGIMKALS